MSFIPRIESQQEYTNILTKLNTYNYKTQLIYIKADNESYTLDVKNRYKGLTAFFYWLCNFKPKTDRIEEVTRFTATFFDVNQKLAMETPQSLMDTIAAVSKVSSFLVESKKEVTHPKQELEKFIQSLKAKTNELFNESQQALEKEKKEFKQAKKQSKEKVAKQLEAKTKKIEELEGEIANSREKLESLNKQQKEIIEQTKQIQERMIKEAENEATTRALTLFNDEKNRLTAQLKNCHIEFDQQLENKKKEIQEQEEVLKANIKSLEEEKFKLEGEVDKLKDTTIKTSDGSIRVYGKRYESISFFKTKQGFDERQRGEVKDQQPTEDKIIDLIAYPTALVQIVINFVDNQEKIEVLDTLKDKELLALLDIAHFLDYHTIETSCIKKLEDQKYFNLKNSLSLLSERQWPIQHPAISQALKAVAKEYYLLNNSDRVSIKSDYFIELLKDDNLVIESEATLLDQAVEWTIAHCEEIEMISLKRAFQDFSLTQNKEIITYDEWLKQRQQFNPQPMTPIDALQQKIGNFSLVDVLRFEHISPLKTESMIKMGLNIPIEDKRPCRPTPRNIIITDISNYELKAWSTSTWHKIFKLDWSFHKSMLFPNASVSESFKIAGYAFEVRFNYNDTNEHKSIYLYSSELNKDCSIEIKIGEYNYVTDRKESNYREGWEYGKPLKHGASFILNSENFLKVINEDEIKIQLKIFFNC
jgi:hypothetical protein